MAVNNLFQVAQQAQAFSSSRQPYAISQSGGNLKIDRVTDVEPEQRVHNAEALIDAARIQLKDLNLRNMTVAETEKVRTAVDFASRLIKQLSDSPTINPAVIDRLKAKALSAKLGGILAPEIFTDSRFEKFRRFIEINSIHHQVQALRLQLGRSQPFAPMLPVELNSGLSMEVDWSQLKQVTRYENEKPIGYSFFFGNEEVFQTDLRYKLSDDYTLLHTGIKHYNAVVNPNIIAYDRQNPAEWGHKHLLEIATHLIDKRGEHPKFLLGDHAFVNLKDSTGNCFSVGKFGPSMSNWGVSDYLTAFAKKKGKYRSPDWYSLYPKGSHFQKTYSIELTKAQFDKVFKRYQNDKAKGPPEFSIMKNNCTSYHTQVFKEELGIDVSTTMRPHVFSLQYHLPKSLQTHLFNLWDNTFGKLPDAAQKAAYFFPLVYLPVVIFGLFVKTFTLVNEEGYVGTDLSLFDLLCRPWNFYSHHAFALKESLENIAPNGHLVISRDAQGNSRLIKA